MNPRAAALTTLGGEVFTGREAAAYGLVTTAVPADDLDAEVARVCASLGDRRRPGPARVQADPQPGPGRADRRARRGAGGAERAAVRLRRGPRGDGRVPVAEAVADPRPAGGDGADSLMRGMSTGSPHGRGQRGVGLSTRRFQMRNGFGEFGSRGSPLSEELVENEVAQEQAFVDRVYVQLEKSARPPSSWPARATGAAGSVTRAGSSSATPWSSRPPSGSPSSTPRTRGWSSAASTCVPSSTPPPRYVGRIGLRDANRDSLLIDWRAPAAAVFYQATAAEPQDVVAPGAAQRRPAGGRGRGRAARRRGPETATCPSSVRAR